LLIFFLSLNKVLWTYKVQDVNCIFSKDSDNKKKIKINYKMIKVIFPNLNCDDEKIRL
jgi:hypothetical protein